MSGANGNTGKPPYRRDCNKKFPRCQGKVKNKCIQYTAEKMLTTGECYANLREALKLECLLEWYSSGEETPLLRAQAEKSARRFKSSPLRHNEINSLSMSGLENRRAEYPSGDLNV